MTRCMGPLVSTPSHVEVPNKNGAGNGGGGGVGGSGVQVTRPMLKGMGVQAKVIDKIMQHSGKKEEPKFPRMKGGNPNSKLFCTQLKCGWNSMCNRSHTGKGKVKVPIEDRLGEPLALENGEG